MSELRTPTIIVKSEFDTGDSPEAEFSFMGSDTKEAALGLVAILATHARGGDIDTETLYRYSTSLLTEQPRLRGPDAETTMASIDLDSGRPVELNERMRTLTEALATGDLTVTQLAEEQRNMLSFSEDTLVVGPEGHILKPNADNSEFELSVHKGAAGIGEDIDSIIKERSNQPGANLDALNNHYEMHTALVEEQSLNATVYQYPVTGRHSSQLLDGHEYAVYGKVDNEGTFTPVVTELHPAHPAVSNNLVDANA